MTNFIFTALVFLVTLGPQGTPTRQYEFPIVALPPNMFCNPDYVSMPWEEMIIKKCRPAYDCDDLAVSAEDKTVCTVKL